MEFLPLFFYINDFFHLIRTWAYYVIEVCIFNKFTGGYIMAELKNGCPPENAEFKEAGLIIHGLVGRILKVQPFV